MVPLDKVWRTSLPPELIIDSFIENNEPVSYEDYLTEFVNSSALFLSLSKGQVYRHIPSKRQNNGECDCYTKQYELDFKLLGTQSGIYAKRNLSLQKAYIAPGVLATLIPRQIKGMETTLTNNLLRRYSVDDLLEIDNSKFPKFDRDKLCPELDVQSILKIAKCKKNVLYFYTDFIYSDVSFSLRDIVETVEVHTNECFSNLFRFRDLFVTDKDTFFAIIVQGHMCIAVWQNGFIRFKEQIPLSTSTVFSGLYGTISSSDVAKLILP